MRQERGPRLDMELADGSGKGVGEEKRAGMEDGLFWEEDGLLAQSRHQPRIPHRFGRAEPQCAGDLRDFSRVCV